MLVFISLLYLIQMSKRGADWVAAQPASIDRQIDDVQSIEDVPPRRAVEKLNNQKKALPLLYDPFRVKNGKNVINKASDGSNCSSLIQSIQLPFSIPTGFNYNSVIVDKSVFDRVQETQRVIYSRYIYIMHLFVHIF